MAESDVRYEIDPEDNEARMRNRTKVAIDLHQGDLAGAETLWAEEVSDGRYRLLNTPFFAFGYSWGDIVRCAPQGGRLRVVSIERDSGNATIRIYFATDADSASVQYVLDELRSVGCSYERGAGGLVAVNVPPHMEVPFSQMSNFLNDQGNKVIAGWEVGNWPTESRQ
jgi:hypothetical protein